MTQAPALPWYLSRNDEFHPAAGSPSVRDQDGGVVRVINSVGVEAWLVTRLADVRAVLADSRRFSNALPSGLFSRLRGEPVSEEEATRSRRGSLLSADPPEHTRLRRMLTAV